MKNFTYLLTAVMIGTMVPNVYSQITVTQSDMPAAGKAIAADSDLTPSVSPGNKGPSQTWNFAALKSSKSQKISFVTASSSPYASAFPLANLADTTYGVAGYNYFSSTAGSFSIAGASVVAGFNANAVFNPLFNQISLPANYLDQYAGTAVAKIHAIAVTAPGIDSAKGTIHFTYADTLDAWGSMTTPAGSFSVLREKHYELDIDSLFLHSTIFPKWTFYEAQITKVNQYIWYTNGIFFPLVAMDMDTNNVKAQKVLWYSSPLGINELSNTMHSTVYPNPCSSQITFRNSENAKYLSVFDIAGREVTETTMKDAEISLNTSAYAKGMYIYTITDINGNVLDRGKFSVQ